MCVKNFFLLFFVGKKMTKNRELSIVERAEIVGAWKCGVKVKDISNKLGFREKTVRNIITKYKINGDVVNKPRSGRPKVLSERDVRTLNRIVRGKRQGTAVEFQAELNKSLSKPVCVNTIRTALHESGYYARSGKRKPLVSEQNRKRRLWFAKFSKSFTSEWNNIIFSDESRYVLFDNDSHKWVWRKPSEKYQVDCLIPTVKHSSGIMVWGCFTREKVGPLVMLEGRVTGRVYQQTLQDYLLPFIASLDSSQIWIFQDDNATVHRTAAVKKFKEDNNILSLTWPPQSPDLNPIEHLWDELERRLRKRQSMPKTKQELFSALKEEWFKIEPDVLAKLVDSMPRRVQAVLKSRGMPTRY
jgi:transposase